MRGPVPSVEGMDDLIELVSPEQLPEETSTRFLLDGVIVAVEPEGGRSWWFPQLEVSLVQQELSAAGSYAVSGHGPAGSFAEALAVLREVAQDQPRSGGSERTSGGGS